MSDLTSFNTYKTNAGATVTLETGVPISGSGSLRVHANGTGAGRINMVRNQGQRAFTSGRIRMSAEVDGLFQVPTELGFTFQQSQEDLTGASGTAYAFYWQINSGGNHKLVVAKVTAGIATKTILYQTTGTFALSLGVPLTMQLDWTLDLANLGGILFLAKRGSSLDFSDLVNEPGIINQVSTSGVLTSTVGEGPFVTISGSDTVVAKIDTMRCNRIIVGG